MLVESLDAVLGDLDVARNSEFLLHAHLGGQAVAVPAETAFHPVPPHGLVSGNDVLDVSGQQVAVVGQAVGEGRTVVEDELVISGPLVHRTFESVLRLPAIQEAAFDRRKVCPCGHVWVGLVCAF